MLAQVFVLCLFVATTISEDDSAELPIDARIEFLKFQLREQMNAGRHQQKHHRGKDAKRSPKKNQGDVEPVLLNEDVDYVDLGKVAITPINEDDERKASEKYKLRQLRTTRPRTTLWTRTFSWPQMSRDPPVNSHQPIQPLLPLFPSAPDPYNPLDDVNMKQQMKMAHQSKKLKKNKRSGPEEHHQGSKPLDIFYRRFLEDPNLRDVPIKWLHCETLVTPFLTGARPETEDPAQRLNQHHRTVQRVVQLITMNVTTFDKDDIIALMYQMSNINIRLFTWDASALHFLFRAITNGKSCTFKNLKLGIKELFQRWRLDTSNATSLLAQTRIFRPPCVNAPGQDEFTKTSKGARITTPHKLSDGTACDDKTEEERRL